MIDSLSTIVDCAYLVCSSFTLPSVLSFLLPFHSFVRSFHEKKNEEGRKEESAKRMSTDENPTFCKKNRLFVKFWLVGCFSPFVPCLIASIFQVSKHTLAAK